MELIVSLIALLIVAFWITGIFRKSSTSSLASEASDYISTQIRAAKADKLIETKVGLDKAEVGITELVAFKKELDLI